MRKNRKAILAVVMAVYLVMLFYFLFFSEGMGRTTDSDSYRYNLVLFKEIRRFITQWRVVGLWASILNIAGNVVAFMPFGCLTASLIHPKEKWYLVTLLGFELSLVVETLQLVTRLGSFDVDDLLLNTIGGLLGYAVHWLWRRFLTVRGLKAAADPKIESPAEVTGNQEREPRGSDWELGTRVPRK